MTKRWVSWVAVSSLPQAKKISLDDQKRVNLDHMAKHSGVLVEHLVVPGQSRSIVLFEDAARQIEAYARLYELIKARAFDVLVYLDRSRLGRKASLIMAVVALCEDAGIVCYETDNPPATLDPGSVSHDGQIIGAIKSVGAQNEIERLVERHRKGMIGRVNAGKMPGNVSWAWDVRYTDKGDKYLVVNEAPAASIRRAFELYLSGKGLEAIAIILNDAGYTSPTGWPWTVGSVLPILDKVWTYAGYAEVNRESRTGRTYTRAKGDFPAIIDEQTALAVITEREARHNARRSVNSPYLFSRLVKCDPCGKTMIVLSHGSPHYNRAGEAIKYYSVVRCPVCGRQVAFSKVSRALHKWVQSLSDDSHRLELVNAIDETALQETQAEISQLQKRLQEAAKAKDRATSAYVDGLITKAELQAQRERLQKDELACNNRLQLLQKQIERFRSRAETEALLVSIPDIVTELFIYASVQECNAWLRQYVRIRFDSERNLSVLLV